MLSKQYNIQHFQQSQTLKRKIMKNLSIKYDNRKQGLQNLSSYTIVFDTLKNSFNITGK